MQTFVGYAGDTSTTHNGKGKVGETQAFCMEYSLFTVPNSKDCTGSSLVLFMWEVLAPYPFLRRSRAIRNEESVAFMCHE